jgi:hypothetical protein
MQERRKIMNPGTEILSKIRDRAASMTVKEYEELFEDSKTLDDVEFINIEMRQSLSLKPPAYSDDIYNSFVSETDIDPISSDNLSLNFENTDIYGMDDTFLMAA